MRPARLAVPHHDHDFYSPRKRNSDLAKAAEADELVVDNASVSLLSTWRSDLCFVGSSSWAAVEGLVMSAEACSW